MSYFGTIIFVPDTLLGEHTTVIKNKSPPYEITKHDESRRPLVSCVEVMFALVGFGELIDRYELEVQIWVQKLHQIEYGSVGDHV